MWKFWKKRDDGVDRFHEAFIRIEELSNRVCVLAGRVEELSKIEEDWRGIVDRRVGQSSKDVACFGRRFSELDDRLTQLHKMVCDHFIKHANGPSLREIESSVSELRRMVESNRVKPVRKKSSVKKKTGRSVKKR